MTLLSFYDKSLFYLLIMFFTHFINGLVDL